MIVPYVYYIKHRQSGQFYFGFRKQNVAKGIKPENDLWNNYFTSSRSVKRLLQADGKDSFDVKIIFTNQDSEVCYWYEQKLIKESIKDPLSLNYHYVDFDSGKEMFGGGKPLTEETKKRIGDALRGKKHSKEYAEAISKRQKGIKQRPKSIEAKKKMSESHHGITQIQAAIEAAAISNRGRKWPPGSRKPRGKMSEETKALMRQSQLKRRELERTKELK